MSGFFDRVERELVAAARREARTRAGTSSHRRRRRVRTTLVVLALLALGVPAGAAVREAFTPVREVDGLVRLSSHTVVAHGVLPERGRWGMVASESDVGRCLEVRWFDGPLGPSMGGGCGPAPGEWHVGSSGGGDIPLPYVFSGRAPAEARVVRFVDRQGDVLGRTATQDGPRRYPGAYFALETTVERPRGCLEALDGDGDVVGRLDPETLRAGCGTPRSARGAR